MDARLTTIGHSNHPLATFLGLLAAHGVTAIADVRSQPRSRFAPHYDRERLAGALRAAGIAYVFLGAELGARNPDPACLVDGRADYARIAATPVFQAGVERVRDGLRTHRVCLMCSERDPLDCHRTILVGARLHGPDLPLVHLLADGGSEAHADAERRLLARHGLDQPDLFRSDAQRLAEAYRRQGEAMAWRP